MFKVKFIKILSFLYLSLILFSPIRNQVQAAVAVYVTNFNSHNLSVIDVATNAVISGVSQGIENNPLPIAISPNGRKADVGNYGSHSVSVVDIATNTVDQIIPVGMDPIGIAVTPNGKRVYVANNTSNSISVIDTATQAVIQVIPVTTPGAIAITPNGKKAYVPSNSADLVTVFDLSTNTPITTISFGGGAVTLQSVAITPSGEQAYVGSLGDVGIINTLTDTVITTLAAGGAAQFVDIKMTPSGPMAYVCNTSGVDSVTPIDVETQTVLPSIPLGVGPDGIAMTRDGTFVYIATDNDTVRVIDTATNTLLPTAIPVGSSPKGLAATPLPISAQGKSQKNTFLIQTDIFNVITWFPIKPTSVPMQYKIYRDAELTNLIATFSDSSSRRFEDHNLRKNSIYTYYITGENGNGVVYIGETSIKTLN